MYSVCIYTLIKVVSYYDLSVLSMSVMGFQKKVWMGGGCGLSKFFLDFLNFFNFTKPLNLSEKLRGAVSLHYQQLLLCVHFVSLV